MYLSYEKKSQLIVADVQVLPDVFTKVLEVKKLMAQKGEKSFASACKRIGILRSAYYKYKDCVFSYEELFTRRIVNMYLLLNDHSGVLSSVLAFLHGQGANVLTVNQSIPVDGAAAVNISLRLTENSEDELASLNSIIELDGVLDVKLLSAE
ncbi:MAG: ACT domain-containing protein [Ruminococcus sp.]|nr:ACT domain-containing protein [Ruminococcus sp.]